MTPMSRLRATLAKIKGNPSTPGILLLIAMVLALVLDNSPAAALYDALLQTSAGFNLGEAGLQKPLLLWINDGLMAVFFLLVGLEVKREIMEGELSQPSKVILPGVAAIGGMVIPALVYIVLNHGDEAAMKGWAIPMATDIAFALGLLSLFGSRVPPSLKIFLLSLAIIDDLGAIIIIALFYSSDLSTLSLTLAGTACVGLFCLNRAGVRQKIPYMLLGSFLWVCVLKSGVHATLAGVMLAFAIPLKRDKNDYSPLIQLEHTLSPWVMLGIMPVFAFANAGVSLKGLSFDALLEPVPLGITLGLFLGKQLGVFGFSLVAVKAGLCSLPKGASWAQVYAVSLFTGIGFTMSLFISSLAFEPGGAVTADRLGILAGSLLSAVGGALILYMVSKPKAVADPIPQAENLSHQGT